MDYKIGKNQKISMLWKRKILVIIMRTTCTQNTLHSTIQQGTYDTKEEDPINYKSSACTVAYRSL